VFDGIEKACVQLALESLDSIIWSYRTNATITPSGLSNVRSSHAIPALLYLGTHGYRKRRPAADCEKVTRHAFSAGYRHVDSARAYRNEQPCADAIRAFMKESGVSRSEIFFTSKVPPRNMGYDNTKVTHIDRSEPSHH
jgi:diketogulonate reductase-like aldo/keto reductase